MTPERIAAMEGGAARENSARARQETASAASGAVLALGDTDSDTSDVTGARDVLEAIKRRHEWDEQRCGFACQRHVDRGVLLALVGRQERELQELRETCAVLQHHREEWL